MRTPLLESIQECLARAYHAHSKEAAQRDIERALETLAEAIRQVQGAREDAARVSGRVTVDTELFDLLAPKEEQE